MLNPEPEMIRGIFPIFIAYTSTHQILTYWKDHSGSGLKEILFSPSDELMRKLNVLKFDYILPIPQHADRSLKRGHASAFQVARFFSEQLDVKIDQSLQLKELTGIKQANLNEWERRHSENPFLWNEPSVHPTSASKTILIVDDFITTGSTIDKAANAILDKSPNTVIYAASLGWKPKLTKSLT